MTALRISDRELATVHHDVRDGFSLITSFEPANGTAWLDVMGPRGMRPDGEWLRADVTTLRFWVPGPAPLVVAPADRRFDDHLGRIEAAARPLLPADEHRLLIDVLTVVHAAVRASPRRRPRPGHRLSRSGAPDPTAWASALSLADLQAVFNKSVA